MQPLISKHERRMKKRQAIKQPIKWKGRNNVGNHKKRPKNQSPQKLLETATESRKQKTTGKVESLTCHCWAVCWQYRETVPGLPVKRSRWRSHQCTASALGCSRSSGEGCTWTVGRNKHLKHVHISRTESCTNKIVTAFIRNACQAFAASPDTSFPKITIVDICPPYLEHHKPGNSVHDNCFWGRGRCWGGEQMSDHKWCLGIRVCGDKTSCPRWQLNGACIEGYWPGQ